MSEIGRELRPNPSARPTGMIAEGANPATDTEKALLEILTDVARTEQATVDSNFFEDLGADSMVMARFCARIRKRPDLPTATIKDVYLHPTIRSLAAALAETLPTAPVPTVPPAPKPSPRPRVAADRGGPTTGPPIGTEHALLNLLTDVVGVKQATADSNFFHDLGADSMVMARFCARIRKRPDLPAVTIKDVYTNPTIRSLTKAVQGTMPAAPATPAPTEPAAQRRAGTPMYVLCGVIQTLLFAAYLAAAEAVADVGDNWISAATNVAELFLRAAVFGDAAVLAMCILPIVAKWVLIGRWKIQEIPAWSLGYIRFWFVKTLVRANPLLLLVGGRSRSNTTSPVINFYLRALGAKIGPGVAIYCRVLPVCTDLLAIDAGTVIRSDALISCYRAHDGRVQTGPVHLGKNVFVGEGAVIEIGASMGDEAQLGHDSTLHMGQSVPAGETWHGTPAQRTDTNYRLVGQGAADASRKAAVFGVMQLLRAFVIAVPLTVSVLVLALDDIPQFSKLLDPGPGALASWPFYRDMLTVSGILFGVPIVAGLLISGTIPRALNRMIKPDTEYPLFGFHYGIHNAIARMTNNKLLCGLFGDSSYIVHYLRWIGYDLTTVVQTGSNFGTVIKHENPYLVTVGSGTMVADALSIMNADFSNTSFRLSRAKIGTSNFLGNVINYPAQSTVGDNCLIASKAMVPIDGPIREDTGLLGSPTFPIPRTVARDAAYHLGRAEQRQRLHAKNRHNIVTMVLYLLVRWAFLFSILVYIGALSELYEEWNGPVTLVLSGSTFPLFAILYWVFVERASSRFRRLQPRYCSIYDPLFWRHEQYWKLNEPNLYMLYNGTPLKNILWRMLGVRVGRRFFDDGLFLSERSLVTIGDDCTANQMSLIFPHSQEDGVFKSDYVTVGSRVTIGAGAFINYGVTVGDDAVIEPHAFVMKGEEISDGAISRGNPAVEVRDDHDLTRPVGRVAVGTADD
ncbi:hypothetical protein GCM10009608_16660 [Pseudonocardia alaniniphila]